MQCFTWEIEILSEEAFFQDLFVPCGLHSPDCQPFQWGGVGSKVTLTTFANNPLRDLCPSLLAADLLLSLLKPYCYFLYKDGISLSWTELLKHGEIRCTKVCPNARLESAWLIVAGHMKKPNRKSTPLWMLRICGEQLVMWCSYSLFPPCWRYKVIFSWRTTIEQTC